MIIAGKIGTHLKLRVTGLQKIKDLILHVEDRVSPSHLLDGFPRYNIARSDRKGLARNYEQLNS